MSDAFGHLLDAAGGTPWARGAGVVDKSTVRTDDATVVRAALAALAVAASAAAAAQASASSMPKRLAPKPVQKCLLKHGITNGILSTTGMGKDVTAPGELWVINAFFPPAPVGDGDDAGLSFFTSPALAAKGEARLVSLWVLGTAIPSVQVGPKVPKAAVPGLHHRYLNVVVTWQYPRHHAARDDATLRDCLKAQ